MSFSEENCHAHFLFRVARGWGLGKPWCLFLLLTGRLLFNFQDERLVQLIVSTKAEDKVFNKQTSLSWKFSKFYL
jgi:hypothetical protein